MPSRLLVRSSWIRMGGPLTGSWFSGCFGWFLVRCFSDIHTYIHTYPCMPRNIDYEYYRVSALPIPGYEYRTV